MSFLELALTNMPSLLRGLGNTVILTAICISLGFILGLIMALLKVYGRGPLRWFAVGYIGLLRGTPLITQLFLIYFGLGAVGIKLSPFVAAITAISLNSSAYQAEYFRSSILAVQPGQLIGAQSLGMNFLQVVDYVVIPQAVRLVIPGWSNELIHMIKYSSLAYLIQYRELLFEARYIASRNFRTLEILLVAAFLYLSVVIIVSFLLRQLEARVRIPGLGSGDAG